ncbi:hypothetical protein BGX33_003326, partial [Mortierella sp. NVP41]
SRSQRIVRQRLESELIASLKALTSWDVRVVSSSAKGVHISDFDLELLMIYTESSEPGATAESQRKQLPDHMNDLLTTLTSAGYKSVHFHHRHPDLLCKRNDDCAGFYDPKSDLTWQISLLDSREPTLSPVDLRDMIQAYADIDSRVEPFISAVLRILDKHGRSRHALSNLTVVMIAVHYLQSKSILPQLLSHQAERANFEFHSGPIDNMLPEDNTVVSDERILAECPKEALDMIFAMSDELRNKSRRSAKESTSKKQGKGGTGDIDDDDQVPMTEYKSIQERWEAVTGVRMSLTDYDMELAKVR